MGVPGSSSVYFGGTVAYNTRKSGKLLCGDDELHRRLLSGPVSSDDGDDELLDEHTDLSQEARKYIKSKLHWTRETAVRYCQHVDTDFAIAEGGATGPTFRPEGLETGFAVLAVAGRGKDGGVQVLSQKIIRSSHANRQGNMRLFADSAAELCLGALGHSCTSEESKITNEPSDSGIHLDRSSHLRNNDTKMQEFHQDPNALHVLLRGTDEVMFASTSELVLATLADIIEDGTIGEDALTTRTFLGRLGQDQTPVFAISLPKDAAYNQNGYFATTRSRAPMLKPLHNELALTATAYANWQKSHQFCYICGSPLEYVHGSTVRYVCRAM